MSPHLRNRLLVWLHRWNGWNVLFLLVSGVVLYLPSLRGVTAPVRVPLKTAHIASGLLMGAMLLGYLALLPGHWERLRGRWGQRLNAALLVAVTAGWLVTGIILWLHRSVPPAWASAALLWHDYLTWIMVPWLVAHSVTRYFRIRVPLPGWLALKPRRHAGDVNYERRAALVSVLGSLAASAWGFYGWRFLNVSDELPGAGPMAASADAQAAAPAPAAAPITFPDTPPPHTEGDPPIPVPMKTPPTGGGRDGRFRVYTVTDTLPAFRPDTWRFFVRGLVDRPLELNWTQFLHLPRREQVSDFHCVTGWSVYHITWEGVRLRDLLDLVGVQEGADHVKFYSHDGVYTDDLSLDVARRDNVMLAYLIDGQLLPSQLGGPMRLIIPPMYAYKSVKWLAGVELIQGPHVGYWEERGYPRDAWVHQAT